MNNTQGGRGGGGAAVGGISLPVKQECIHKMLNNSHDWKQSRSQKFWGFFLFWGGGGFKSVSDLRAGRIIFGSAAVSSQAAFSEIREVPDVADRRSDWHGHIQTTRKFTDRGYSSPPQPTPPSAN